MPITLTQAEIDALLAERTRLVASIAKRTESEAAQDSVVQAATDADSAEKKAFDLYDAEVINRYEDEREELDGTYVNTPVTKTELDEVGQLIATQRLFPVAPITVPTRIAQFDGTPLITTANQIAGVVPDPASPVKLNTEPYWISRQAFRETWLQTGFGGTSPTITPTTYVVGAVTPSTLQITVRTTDSSENAVFAVGDTFVAKDGSNQVGVLVTNVVSQVNGDPLAGSCAGESNPPQTTQATCEGDGGTWTPAPTFYEAVLDVLVLTPLSLSASATIDETWAGFSNADRTAKVDSTDGYTSMLLAMIDDLEDMLDFRKLTLDAQRTALLANQDPGLAGSALTNVDASRTVITAWKVSKNVANSDLATLASDRTSRSTQITARITAINAVFTAPTNYFNLRYTSATNIADTSRGTARIKYFRIGSQGVTAGLKATEEARLASIDALLTLAGVTIP